MALHGHKLRLFYFSLTRIFMNLKMWKLQSNHLKKLVFLSKNWPNDLKIGCNSTSNLVKLIEKNLEFGDFEHAFEQDEVVEMQ